MCLVAQSCPTPCDLINCSPSGSSVHGDSLGKNAGVSCHALLQGIGELYKKGLNDPDNHDGVITHLEPDILECEVKWALGSIKTSKGGIPAELFQVLKDDAVKVLHSICQQMWETQQWPQDWKRSVLIPIPKKDNVKECSDYHTIALISYASKVILKILQLGLKST